ncbi:MAG: hypothetical protein JWM11_2614 [Planctomycetaceae bacterium]|nr:hypothetical protein [Planctomycetaceae bacterium]
MFQFLATRIVRNWKFFLCAWLLLGVLANGVVAGWLNHLHVFSASIPRWDEIVDDGEAVFFPRNMPTRQAAEVFKKAFPDDRLSSSAVVILERADGPLTDQDRSFVEQELTPRLVQFQKEPDSIISRIRDFNDNQIGKLLQSQDGKATLVIVELKNDFLDLRNTSTIARIEQLVNPDRGELRTKIPD